VQGHKEISGTPYGILAPIKNGELFTQGEWGGAICDLMKPDETDIVCKGKSGLCGFHSTNLDFTLRQNGIKNVAIAGFLTNCCVESTMRSAYERGYQVYTLTDCCAATSVAGHDASVEHTFGMFSVPTTGTELVTALKATA
jgi:nicotinamidase-related amidase